MDSEIRVGPEAITKNDIFVDAPEVDGTALVVQRHEEYIRDGSHPERGSLTQEAARRSREQTASAFRNILEQIPENERGLVDVMVVGSPTQYRGGGRRSMETASQVLVGISDVFTEYNLSPNQILNNQERLKLKGGPIKSKSIVEPKIFTDNPDFVEFLKKEYGGGAINRDFFKAYEDDLGEVKITRLAMGAEGSEDMANRLANYLYALKLYSEKYHAKHPGRRLVVWTVSHYDTISPYIKTRIGGGIDGFLGVDYGAGFAINLKSDGTSTTRIGGMDYPVSLVKASTASSIDK